MYCLNAWFALTLSSSVASFFLAFFRRRFFSFLAASSFQNTRKVLSATVVNGSSDWLRGLKSHVILGSSVPVGTGTAFTLKFPMPIAFLYTQWHIIHLDLKHLELDLVELDNAD